MITSLMMLHIDIVVVIIVLIIGDGLGVAFFILWKLSKRCGGVAVANG